MNFKEKILKKSKIYSSERPLTAVFLGDSVTHGCFECFEDSNGGIGCICDQEAVYSNIFRNKFHSAFPFIPLSVINSGISGGKATEGAERMERDVMSYSPDLVVVCFGLNDVFCGDEEAYLNGLLSIFTRLNKSETNAVFLTPNMICTQPKLSPIKSLHEMSERCAEIQNDGTFDKYIKDACDIAKQNGIKVCDCYSDWRMLEKSGADTTRLLANYINHPTREMHGLFASELFKTILL